MSQTGGPPYLTPGTEVSAKYKGAFCEAKIKRCQKSVKCKVSPRDGGPQISVADDAVQGELKIGGSVKIRQPDSGQIIDGTISRIIDSSVYTVVFDDGDVATLKRTQICLKGDKHYMEGDTLDRLPLTNPEHFSTPVNLLKKERRRRSGYATAQSSGTLSEDSDIDEEAASTSRRISPRGATKPSLDVIGKVLSLEVGDKRKWAPALVVKSSHAEMDTKVKGMFTVKSFRDNKVSNVTERQVKEFTKDLVKNYADDKLTRAAVDKALKYLNTQELPASWKKEELLGRTEPSKPATPLPAKPSLNVSVDSDEESDSSSEDEEEKSDMFIAQLYKFMDDRSTPINKPAQLYSRDVNLSRLYQKVRRFGGFNKVSASGKWKYVATKLGFSGISAGTEMKLLYRRYLVAFEEFYKKMGDTHMFEMSRSQRHATAGGRNVLPPRDREPQHSSTTEVKGAQIKSTKDTTKPGTSAESKASAESKVSPSTKASLDGKLASVTKSADNKSAALDQAVKVKPEPGVPEDTPRRTPIRQASSKKEDRQRPGESPKRPDSSARGRATYTKSNIKVEKAAKLNLDDDKPSTTGRTATPPVLSALSTPGASASSAKNSQAKGREESMDTKADTDSIVSEEPEDNNTVSVEVDYPPNTKIKVRYGRARNIKIYDAKVMEVRLGEDKQPLYSVHYSGWNVRYDEIISSERIVGTTGKCEKRRMDLSKDGFNSRKKGKTQAQIINSSSSTGSRTPEPPSSAGRPSASQKASAPISKPSKSASSAGNTPGSVQPSNRTTRSSVSDISLPRPTRSKSTDSTLSAGLFASRKVRQKKPVQADEQPKVEPTIDPDNEASTEGESNAGDLDLEKVDKAVPTDTSTQVNEDCAGTKEKKEVKSDSVDRKTKANSSVPEQSTTSSAVLSGDRTPRRNQRRASKHSLASSSVGVDEQLTADAGSAKKAVKRLEPSTEEPTTNEIQNKMSDVIDQVDDGELTATQIDAATEVQESPDSDSSAPPAKRQKVDREDSSGSVASSDEPFVKIEPLKHKKAGTPVASPPADDRSDGTESKADEGDAETEAMHLPPLIGGSTKCTLTETESSKTSRASSGVDDSELSYHSSDNECKSPGTTLTSENVIKCEPAATGATATVGLYRMSDAVTSNLSLLSEQASNMETNTSNKRPRGAATRRQMAKRSPRPKHADTEMSSAYDQSTANTDQEVSHLTQSSDERISPTKILRSAPPRAPRQPKYNFRIEEELAEIDEQDARIAYLMSKLSEIRTLYTDVKSNLASIERKRKRVRQRGQRDRDHLHQPY